MSLDGHLRALCGSPVDKIRNWNLIFFLVNCLLDSLSTGLRTLAHRSLRQF